MSSVVGKTLSITLDNKGTYLSGSGTIDMSMTTNLGITSGSNKTGYVAVTSQGMLALFPNNVARPLRLTVSYYHYALTSNANNYSCLSIDGTQVISTASSEYKAETYDNSGAIATALTKASSIQWTLHTKSKSLFETTPWTALGGYEGIQITTYFNQYGFSATAGTGIASASVSSAAGFDGDTIQYRCALASGSTWIGWYQNGTLYSSTKDLNVTVNGTDLILEARATAPLTTLLTASYNGSNIISEQKAGAVSYSYGSISGTITSGQTKTMQCGGKVCLSNIVIGGRILPCSGHLMATDVVITYQ